MAECAKARNEAMEEAEAEAAKQRLAANKKNVSVSVSAIRAMPPNSNSTTSESVRGN